MGKGCPVDGMSGLPPVDGTSDLAERLSSDCGTVSPKKGGRMEP